MGLTCSTCGGNPTTFSPNNDIQEIYEITVNGSALNDSIESTDSKQIKVRASPIPKITSSRSFNNTTNNLPKQISTQTNTASLSIDTDSIIRIQSFFRSFFFRKSFLLLKPNLESEEKLFISEYIKYHSPNITILQFETTKKKFPYNSKYNKINLPCKLRIYNDSYYIGRVDINGKRNGNGRLVTLSKGIYEGLWKDDMIIEYGRHIDNDANCYEGQFVNGVKEGKGEIVWKTGKRYIGSFKNDRPHGKGVFYINSNEGYNVLFDRGKIVKTSKIV